jgi:hypothetical protein
MTYTTRSPCNSYLLKNISQLIWDSRTCGSYKFSLIEGFSEQESDCYGNVENKSFTVAAESYLFSPWLAMEYELLLAF